MNSFSGSNLSDAHELQHAELLVDGLEVSPKSVVMTRMLVILACPQHTSGGIALLIQHLEI
jgi:hypothetical protein